MKCFTWLLGFGQKWKILAICQSVSEARTQAISAIVNHFGKSDTALSMMLLIETIEPKEIEPQAHIWAEPDTL